MSSPEPGTYNWTQHVGPLPDGLADRMNRTALFFVGTDAYEELEDARVAGRPADLSTLVEPEIRDALDEIASQTGEDASLLEAEAGRGSGTTGIAVAVAEALATYGGATAAVVETARAVRWAYRRLSEVRGHRVMVSLGAAEYLAAADLVDRIGAEGIELVGSGDMQSRNQDRSFSGGDAFYVVLEAAGSLHHYQVTSYGELTYVGTSPPIAHYMEADPSQPDWL